jgi:hypothetical protein
MHSLSSLKSDIVRTVLSFLGMINVTCCCREGLTIAVIAMAVQGVMGLEGTTVGLATLAKLLTATLLSDSTSRAPRCLALQVTLGFRWGCTALPFCLKFCAFLNHDSLYGFKVW